MMWYGSAVLLAGFLYLAVAVAGVISILFMAKPLFAPLPKQPPTVTLDPISQPALFALIYHICDLVGAPRPVMVEVDSQVNASASFRRGMVSFFGHDLVLSIGMPLVAGMTARQFAGVLAHEFGHFAQSGGMRLNHLVRSINHWFARVVFERDGWDHRLDALCSREGYSGMMGNVARITVGLGRMLMSLLMHVGGAISGFMSRQMEYDADAYGAKVAGSQEMVGALLQLELLGQAEAAMLKTMLSRLKDGQLPENVPGRIARHVGAMPESMRKQVKGKVLAGEASWRSTHPALKQRQEKLEEEAAPGVCQLDMPAEELFRDFTGLCKTVSLYWYDVELGLDLNEFDLVDVDGAERLQMEKQRLQARKAEEKQDEDQRAGEARDQQRKEQLREAAVREMFGHLPSAYRLMTLPMATPEDWAPAASKVAAWKAEYGAACELEKQQRDSLCKRTLACHLLHLGHDLTSLAAFGTDTRSAAALMAAQAESLRAHETISKQLAVFEQAAWTRITAALAWRFQQGNSLPMWREGVTALVEAQRALAAAMQPLMSVCVDAMLLEQINAVPADHRPKYEARLHAEIVNILRVLGTAVNPYGQNSRTLAETIGVQSPATSNGCHSPQSYALLRNNLCHYVNQVTGDLSALAHEVELGWETGAGRLAFRTSSSAVMLTPATA